MQAAAQTPPDLQRLLTDSSRMLQLADQVRARTNAQIDAERSDLQERTQWVQKLLFWGSVLLLPLTGIAILLFSVRVGGPLRQIDRAINELGSGALHRPIGISGPADLAKLGRQLEWLRQRLLDLAQERSRFLRHMSHELKTPAGQYPRRHRTADGWCRG